MAEVGAHSPIGKHQFRPLAAHSCVDTIKIGAAWLRRFTEFLAITVGLARPPTTAAEMFRSGVTRTRGRFRILAALQFVLHRLADEQGKPAVADKRLDTTDRVGS